MRPTFALFACLFLSSPLFAQRDAKELAPRLVTIEKASVADALKLLHDQTGNVVLDRRAHPKDVKLDLNLKNVPFWQALDNIVRQAGCGYSLYQLDGELCLVDTPLRKMPVTYSGIFRVAAKRVAVVRDEDSGSHTCNVTLEVAWEPRFQPLHLDVGSIDATFAAEPNGQPTSARADGLGKMTVAGRGAVEIEVRLKAPPRKVLALTVLNGRLVFLGPTKMLTFDFSSINPGEIQRQTQDDIEVVLTPLPRTSSRWPFDVKVQKPEIAVALESFQEDVWLANNRILLRRTQGRKVETITALPAEMEQRDFSKTHPTFRYRFTRDLPDSPLGWTLQYRTPARIVELPMTFSLGEILLP